MISSSRVVIGHDVLVSAFRNHNPISLLVVAMYTGSGSSLALPPMDLTSTSSTCLNDSDDINLSSAESSVVLEGFDDVDDAGVLIGRDAEQNMLFDALRRIQAENGLAEAVLIQGSSGTGKTALVSRVRSLVSKQVESEDQTHSQQRLLWATGKYGQNSVGSRPYSALEDAFTNLFRQLRQNEEVEADIRERIRAFMSDEDISLVCSMLPALQEVMGCSFSTDEGPLSDDEDEPVSSTSQANSFTFRLFLGIFRKFLLSLCSERYPLVLFLDDLQWADAESRTLLNALVNHGRVFNFLFIGVVRTEQGDPTFNFSPAKCRMPFQNVILGPLSEEGVREMVVRSLQLSNHREEEANQLSSIVFLRTAGNPHFVVQFLELLFRKHMLVCPEGEEAAWDIDNICKETDLMESVAILYTQKIAAFSSDVRMVLAIASILGHTFSSKVLKHVFADSKQGQSLIQLLESSLEIKQSEPGKKQTINVSDCLRESCAAGLLESMPNSRRYRFTHDRVQHSAGSQVLGGTGSERIKALLGEILSRLMQSSSRNEATFDDGILFVATNLLIGNLSLSVSKTTVAELCLKAGRKACKQVAFRSASRYAESGLEQLGEKCWSQNYNLTLELYNLATEMYFAQGDRETCHDRAAAVCQHAKRLSDTFRVERVKLECLDISEKWLEATLVAKKGLAALGVSFPEKPTLSHCVRTILKSRRMMKGRSPEQLELDLPENTDESQSHKTYLLGKLFVVSYRMCESYSCCVANHMMLQETLAHGFCDRSVSACVSHAVFLASRGDMRSAYEFSKLSMRLAEKYPAAETKARLSHFAICNPLFEPLKDSFAGLDRGITAGLVQGEVTYACTCAVQRTTLGIYASMQLYDHER